MQQRVAGLIADRRTATWAMLAALVVAVPVIARVQHGAFPLLDEWPFLFYRESWSLHDILRNYNGHLVPLTAIALNVDRGIFHAGAQPFLTAVSVLLQVGLAWFVFVFARRRVDAWLAFMLATLLLIYGAGYEIVAWSFNLGWVASLTFGMAALCLYELERSRGRDIGVVALLLLSLMGCNVGLVFPAALALRAFAKDERRRAIGIVALPLVLWGLWYLIDLRTAGSTVGYFPKAWPAFILELFGRGFGGLLGVMPNDPNAWGPPIAVVATLGALVALSRRGRLTPEIASLAALPVIFWMLTAIGRGGWSPASASRYTYVSFVLLVPLGSELARGFRIRGSALAVGLAVIWLMMVGTNLNSLSQGAQSLRNGYNLNRVYLSALVGVGEKTACASAAKSWDFGIKNEGNCKVRRWVVSHGPSHYIYSPAALAADPVLAKQVADTEAQLRTEKSAQGSK